MSHLAKHTKHISNVCGIECNVFDVNFNQIQGDYYCRKCSRCDYINTHKYGSYEAQRWNGRYIYYCPAGFIFIAVVINDDLSRIDAGVLAGPLIMGDIDDFVQDFPLINTNVPNIKTYIVNDIAEIMSAVFANKEQKYIADFEGILNGIYKAKDVFEEKAFYPIDLEKKLQSAIKEGDSKLSKELLNKLLGHIFFCSNGDFKTIKARVVELVVLLSRSVIDGGADLDQIFILNKNYIEEIEDFSTIDDLSIWLSFVINRFISYVFEFKDIKHSDALFKAMNYVRNNYNKKISLEDISEYVYLSKSYLSKIFKDEMNCTLTNYINNVRVEKSKSLLLDSSLSLADIAYMVGFEDQSYYTKVFKKVTGVSPGKYKISRGKKEIE